MLQITVHKHSFLPSIFYFIIPSFPALFICRGPLFLFVSSQAGERLVVRQYKVGVK